MALKKQKRQIYYQVNTRNTSFIKMYRILKQKGIQNNKFFLKLYDKSLMDLDPFDEDNLTLEQKARINRECKRNFWYFIRECVKVPVAGGDRLYELHRGNLAENWSLLRNIKTIVILPRQHGKTIAAVVFYLWLYNFATTNSDMAFFNKEFGDSKANLKRLKDLRDKLPTYLQHIDPINDTDNLTVVESGTTGNKITAKPSANDIPKADNLGRGATQPCQYYDEFAFLKYNSVVFTAATPANSQASIEAKRNGKPCHILITTTPGDLNTEHGIYCYDMINDAAKFREEMYDWKMDRINKYLETNSQNDFLFITFTYKQLGRDEAWFRKQCRSLNNDWAKIKREILLEWNKASDLSPFSEEEVERLTNDAKDEVATLYIKENYPLSIYDMNYDFRASTFIGVDVAGGLSRDSSAITVASAKDLSIIADFKNNTIDPVELADVIYSIAKLYYTNGPIIIERNSYGLTVINILLKTDIANRIYYEKRQKIGEKQVKDIKQQSFIKTKTETRVYGVNTDNKTRPMMMDLLRNIINDTPECLCSKNIVADIAGLERTKTGKIEHGATSHDDILMSYLVIRYIWAFGTNLSRFNINKTAIAIGDESTSDSTKSIINAFNMISVNNKINNRFQSNGLNSMNIINEYYTDQMYQHQKDLQSRIEKGQSSGMLSFINSLNK